MGVFWVALGGAVGSAGRYAISLIPFRSGFPALTLATNVLGAALIGFIVGLATNREDLPLNATLFWKTGVCGGFTTFSTFSLETIGLIESRSYFAAGLYMFLSVALCLVGILCGRKVAVLTGRFF